MLFGRKPASGVDDVQGSGTGVPVDPEDVEVIEAPADPQERQEFIQSMVAEVTERFSGEPLEVVIEALSQRIAASGLPEQPIKWVTDTASEITEGRHVVVDRHLGIRPGGEGERVPDEARDPGA